MELDFLSYQERAGNGSYHQRVGKIRWMSQKRFQTNYYEHMVKREEDGHSLWERRGGQEFESQRMCQVGLNRDLQFGRTFQENNTV